MPAINKAAELAADAMEHLAPGVAKEGLNLLDIVGEKTGVTRGVAKLADASANVFAREGILNPSNFRSFEEFKADFLQEHGANTRYSVSGSYDMTLESAIDQSKVAEVRQQFLDKTGVVANLPPREWRHLYGTELGKVQTNEEGKMLRVPHPTNLDDPAQILDFRHGVVERHMLGSFGPSGSHGWGFNLNETLQGIIEHPTMDEPIKQITRDADAVLRERGLPALPARESWLSLTTAQQDVLADTIAKSDVHIHELRRPPERRSRNEPLGGTELRTNLRLKG